MKSQVSELARRRRNLRLALAHGAIALGFFALPVLWHLRS
jgi:hypothetical protein